MLCLFVDNTVMFVGTSTSRYCLRRREAPRFMLEHLPSLYTSFCDTIYEDIDLMSNEKFFGNALYGYSTK